MPRQMPAPDPMPHARPRDLAHVHFEALTQWRASMNLIGPGPIALHFDDCHAALDVLKHVDVDGDWLDLGSGAGFPGLVLAQRYPTLHIQLIESRQKRVAFLRHVLMRAQAPLVEVLERRVESLPDGYANGIISRAFAPPPAVFKHALRLLRPRGILVLMLQAAEEPQIPPMFHVEHRLNYVISGKARQAICLRYAATR